MFWLGFEKKALQVYRNVNKGGGEYVYSMRDGGRVKGHTQDLLLRNAVMRVGERGRDRVRSERRKNVHAYIKGDPVKKNTGRLKFTRISYDPYKHEGFVTEDGSKVTLAKLVKFTPQGVFAHKPS